MRMASEWLILLMMPSMTLASLRIVSPNESPFVNQSIPCVVHNSMMGPQMGALQAATPTTGQMFILMTDPCSLSDIPDAVRGRIIVTTMGTCALPSLYTNLVTKQVAAIVLIFNQNVPGLGVYANYGGMQEMTRVMTVPLYQVPGTIMSTSAASLSFGEYIQSKASTNPSLILLHLTPDVNQWISTFDGVLYQIVVRLFPTLILMVAALSSILFFAVYMMIYRARYWGEPSSAFNTGWMRFFRYILRQFNLSQLLLIIETFSCLMLAFVFGVGGWYSTSVLNANLVVFSTTVYSGWGFACDVIAARIWHEMNVDNTFNPPMPTLSRVIKHPIGGAMMITIPVLLDTALGLMYAGVIPNIDMVNLLTVLVLLLLQLTIGTHFINESYRFQKALKRIGRAADENTRGNATVFFTKRFCILTGRLGICCVIYVIEVPFAATPLLYTPTGWTVFWAITLNLRALTSLCRVIMFRPKPHLTILDLFRELTITTESAERGNCKQNAASAKIAPIPN